MRLPRRLLSTSLILVLTGAAFSKPPAPDATAVERMTKDLYFLAGPECEGRGVGTAGLDRAADHVAAAFKEAGLKPAMPDGSYFQPFTMNGFPEIEGPSTLAFLGPDGEKLTPQYEDDFVVTGYSSGGKTSGGLVFVGGEVHAGFVQDGLRRLDPRAHP